MILEKAYQKTMQDHVGEDAPTENAAQTATTDPPRAPACPSPSPKPPLVEGSSTALVAVLEHPRPRAKPTRPLQLFGPSPRHTGQDPVVAERGAMLTIAHLGDCMGMLIRDDILILASDGLSDNLWDEDVLDEVIRFRRPFLSDAPGAPAPAPASKQGVHRVLGRGALAAMLSEALCSRARRAAERRVDKSEWDAEMEVPFARRARELGRSFTAGSRMVNISVLVAVVSPAEGHCHDRASRF
ncbi:uncharacterized protein B0H18DRAFT_1033471 [Fomitopsis serialis]|uniref:uncharacterized protein n=1 Tax=Fomitopsis serialis TaxID=139415 RepID=UPI0020087A51|nr:uncharacterized protein B0H18DRAFT_1033471 [Neoantrodia serialis]KAH9917794.1 hypothetical protein B0H18DRAFT_1033471 [Neoantrodia serialis]